MIQTNWYVITGGPGSGKTTTINLLTERGYKTTIEHARHYIDTQRLTGKTTEALKENQAEFQMRILEMQLQQEASLHPNDVIFLDRALPDALAYYKFLNLPVSRKLLDALEVYRYKKIFVLDLLPLVPDYARLEDDASQQRIHELLIEVYTDLEYEVIHVPLLPAEHRVEFILNHL